MVATRKTKVSPEPVSATESADADNSQETLDNTKGLSRLRSGSTTDIENVRVWPLCFAIAIEKSRRIRPGIMVASSSLLAGVSYHLHESDSELLPTALILSPLTVFILVETATLCAAFFILLPGTIAQAYREDKTTAFLVEDSAVLSALPTAVARFAVGSGIAWQRVALAVVRDGALFMTLYLLCVALLVGGEDDVDLEPLGDESMSDSGESAFRRVGWQEMEGGISVHSYSTHANSDDVAANYE